MDLLCAVGLGMRSEVLEGVNSSASRSQGARERPRGSAMALSSRQQSLVLVHLEFERRRPDAPITLAVTIARIALTAMFEASG